MTEYKILELLNKAFDKALEVTGRNLRSEGWSTGFNTRKRTLGLCKYNTKTIEISTVLCKAISEEEVYDTCLHEVAHALCTYKDGHNAKWKRTFLLLGGSGTRLFDGKIDGEEIGANYFLIDSRNGEQIAHYFRKPSRNFDTCIVKGDKTSLGKLKVIDKTTRIKHPTKEAILHFFSTQEKIENTQPKSIIKKEKIAKWYLVNTLEPIDKCIVQYLNRKPKNYDFVKLLSIKGKPETLGKLRYFSHEQWVHYKKTL